MIPLFIINVLNWFIRIRQKYKKFKINTLKLQQIYYRTALQMKTLILLLTLLGIANLIPKESWENK